MPVHALEYFSDTEVEDFIFQQTLTEKNSSSYYPLRLRIPKLNVNAKINYVGITRAGNMASPSNITDVGWYKYGTVPGNKGSAVIAGHVDNRKNIPGVFNRLEDLRKGDEIYVETTNDSKPIRFVVTDREIYDFDAKVEKIFNQNDASILRLITCTGVWVPEYGTRDKRLVVTAERVDSI